MISYQELNGREERSTVFIVGAGPQLGKLPPHLLDALSNRPAIGVNLSQYMFRPRYFLSSYAEHHILARHRVDDGLHIHLHATYGPPVLDYLMVLKRKTFRPGMTLPRRLKGPEPILVTMRNVCLAATHLALILGAKRIAYVGVEQENELHFYHHNHAARRAIEEDLDLLLRYEHIPREFNYRSYDVIRKLLQADPEVLASRPFGARQEATFAAFFEQLSGLGVEIVSTTPSGVTIDAGASYLPIEECLRLSN